MNFTIRVHLTTTPEQQERLQALQSVFAQVCNAMGPLVQQTRCWNRVALHHMFYKSLREKFPALGSQMVCNAIYSVSRTCRQVYQHPDSKFNVTRLGDKPLPLLRFSENCPVYFDRHTLSVKEGQMSIYSLDGRMHFKLALSPDVEKKFHDTKLQEIVLSRRADLSFELMFSFDDVSFVDADSLQSDSSAPALGATERNEKNQLIPVAESAKVMPIPQYVMIEEVE